MKAIKARVSQKKVIELNELRNRLREAEDTLSAIRNGEVDALIVSGPAGDHVFSLKGAEQPYRVFVEQMQQGALTLSSDGAILFCNRRFAELIRTPLQRVIGSQFKSHVREEDRDAVDQILGSKDVARGLTRLLLRASDGALRPVSLSASPLPLEDVHGVCLVVTDLTEQEELVAAEQANAAKDQFLAALSHELRTPLTPVLMTVAALESDERLPQDVRESLVLLRRNIELEARLIDDLLDLTRIARNKVDLRLDVVDLHDALRGALAICAGDLQAKKLEFTTTLTASPSLIRGDAARVQQILWNLLRNAIKFTPAGGTIRVETRNAADCVEVSVIDSGIGIDAEALSRIFLPFEQASRQITRTFGGLGLGLAISRKLVEIHGGTLTASSRGAGQGATFTLRLPATADLPAPDRTSADSANEAHRDERQMLRILLVEDHQDTAMLLSRLLQRIGHDVKIANSRAAALDLAASEPFDVMLSDIGLPDGTGHELMRAIGEQYRIPGIALTGYGMEEDVTRSRAAGFVEHIVKPVNLDRLQAVLARATRR
jgi:PAS domain S-box-containing protein